MKQKGEDGGLVHITETTRDLGKTRMKVPRGEDGGLMEVTETEGIPRIKGMRNAEGGLQKVTETRQGFYPSSPNLKRGEDGGLVHVTETEHTSTLEPFPREQGRVHVETNEMSDGGLVAGGPAGNFDDGQWRPSSLPLRHEAEFLPSEHTEYLGHFAEEENLERGHNKNFIAGAIKHPGALHRQLGVPQGEKIPEKKLAAAAEKGGTLGRRARLAETLKTLHK